MKAGKPLAFILATALVIAAVPSLSQAASLRGVVTKVIDGDTVAVKVGKKKRTFNLTGIDAPELGACFGQDAKAQLTKLLKKGKKVKLSARGKSALIGNVNRALVQGGFAKAVGSKFAADQAAAQAAGRGLWSACAEPQPQPNDQTQTNTTPTTTTPTQGDVTGQAAIDQMTRELKGGRWRYFTSGSQSSTEYILNLCEDGTFYRTGNGFTFVWGYGTWKVTEGFISADGTKHGAAVEGTKTQGDPPPDGDPYNWLVGLDKSGGSDKWFVDNIEAIYTPNGASCTI